MFKKHAVFYGVCYLLCSQYSELLASLIVEGMLQNACHIALYSKCDEYKSDVQFEEENIKKNLVIQYHLVNKTVLQMQWIFI
jgi:hypothetical protein